MSLFDATSYSQDRCPDKLKNKSCNDWRKLFSPQRKKKKKDSYEKTSVRGFDICYNEFTRAGTAPWR